MKCSIILFFNLLNCIIGLPYGRFPTTELHTNTPEMYVLEYGPGYATYGHNQMRRAKLLGIKPVVDVTKEEEKYGNDGGITRNLINSFIRFSEGTSVAITNSLGEPNPNTINLLQGFFPLLVNIGNRIAGLA